MKTLKQILELYKPKSQDEDKFVKKHIVVKHRDKNGNGDDVFQATNIKALDRKKERHGYEPGEDEEVYEETEVLDERNQENKEKKDRLTRRIGYPELGPEGVKKVLEPHKGDSVTGVNKVHQAVQKTGRDLLKTGTPKQVAKAIGKVKATHDSAVLRREEIELDESEAEGFHKITIDPVEKNPNGTHRVTGHRRDGTKVNLTQKDRSQSAEHIEDAQRTAREHSKVHGLTPDKSKRYGTFIKPMKEEVERLDEVGDTQRGQELLKRVAARSAERLAASKEKINVIRDKQDAIDAEHGSKAAKNMPQMKNLENQANDEIKNVDRHYKTHHDAKALMDPRKRSQMGVRKIGEEYIEEKLKVSDGIGAWISDFVHSDNPKFEGFSKRKRMKMAQAAFYSAQRGD